MRDEEVGRGARRCARGWRGRSEVYAVVAGPSTAGKMARHSMMQDMQDSDDDDEILRDNLYIGLSCNL